MFHHLSLSPSSVRASYAVMALDLYVDVLNSDPALTIGGIYI